MSDASHPQNLPVREKPQLNTQDFKRGGRNQQAPPARGRGSSYMPSQYFEPPPSRRGADTYRPQGADTYRPQAADTYRPQVDQARRPDPTAPAFTPFNSQPVPWTNPLNSFTPYQPLRFASTIHYPPVQQDDHGSFAQQPRRSARLRNLPPSTAPLADDFYEHGDSYRPLPYRNVNSRRSTPSRDSDPSGPRLGLDPLNQGRRHGSGRPVAPLPVPTPTKDYLEQASQPPVTFPRDLGPRRLLVILDLNGTLILREQASNRPTSFHPRPGLQGFLEYLFKNHTVMIYTSARLHNVRAIMNKLLSQHQRDSLAAVWARDKLELSPEQYNEKIQVYKRLEKLWDDEQIQATYPGSIGRWDQSNTVLIDDSRIKAMAQPHNLIQVPEFTKKPTKKSKVTETKILEDLKATLELLKWYSDVSCLIRKWQTQTLGASTPEPALGLASQAKTKEVVDLTTEADLTDDDGASMDMSSREQTPASMTNGGVRLDSSSRDETPTRSTDEREESPIPDSVWKELLGQGEEAPATPGRKLDAKAAGQDLDHGAAKTI